MKKFDLQRELMTVPNALTLLRAIGIPVFLWTYLTLHNGTVSFLVLGFGAVTDYLDGKLARALNQTSSFGAAFDPFIDRLYIVSTVIALVVRNVIPWILLSVLLLRDLFMLAMLILKRKRSGQVFKVTFLGKAATFNLLYAFPLFLLESNSKLGLVFHDLAWAFACWGVGLYLFTAVQYSREVLNRN